MVLGALTGLAYLIVTAPWVLGLGFDWQRLGSKTGYLGREVSGCGVCEVAIG